MPDDAIWPGVPAGMFPRLRAARHKTGGRQGGQPCLTDGGGGEDGGDGDEPIAKTVSTRRSTIKTAERNWWRGQPCLTGDNEVMRSWLNLCNR